MVVKSKLALAALCLSGVCLILIIFLATQLHRQRVLDQAVSQELAGLTQSQANLSAALSNLNQTASTVKEVKALASTTMLTHLQALLLQNAPKPLLINSVTAVTAALNSLSDASINTLTVQLNGRVDALPNLGTQTALTTLEILKTNVSTLNFVPAVSPNQTTANSVINRQNFWQKLWSQIRPLLVIRSNNAIGADLVTHAARFDAVRNINLLIQETEWQLITAQDPTATLAQLKTVIMTYTVADSAQAAWLSQWATLSSPGSFYTPSEITDLLTTISQLQTRLVTLF